MTMKLRMFRLLTTVAMLAVLIEALGAGAKWGEAACAPATDAVLRVPPAAGASGASQHHVVRSAPRQRGAPSRLHASR